MTTALLSPNEEGMGKTLDEIGLNKEDNLGKMVSCCHVGFFGLGGQRLDPQ